MSLFACMLLLSFGVRFERKIERDCTKIVAQNYCTKIDLITTQNIAFSDNLLYGNTQCYNHILYISFFSPKWSNWWFGQSLT